MKRESILRAALSFCATKRKSAGITPTLLGLRRSTSSPESLTASHVDAIPRLRLPEAQFGIPGCPFRGQKGLTSGAEAHPMTFYAFFRQSWQTNGFRRREGSAPWGRKATSSTDLNN